MAQLGPSEHPQGGSCRGLGEMFLGPASADARGVEEEQTYEKPAERVCTLLPVASGLVSVICNLVCAG